MGKIKLSFKLQEDISKLPFWRALFCEVLGTMIFVLLGTSCAVLGGGFNTSADALRVAFIFGLCFMCLVWTIGPVSGCHLNPSVSVGFFFIGRISLTRTGAYVVAQVVGATLGSAILFGVLPSEKRGNLGATTLAAGIGEGVGFIVEFCLTFFFVMVVCAAVDEGRRDRNKNLAAIPLTLGLCITVITLFGAGFTGPSINPARSIGPAIVGGCWTSHWVYWIGPLVGGPIGALSYRLLFSSEGRPDYVPPPPQSGETPTAKQLSRKKSQIPMIAQSSLAPTPSHDTSRSFYEKKAAQAAANASATTRPAQHPPITETHSDATMVPASF